MGERREKTTMNLVEDRVDSVIEEVLVVLAGEVVDSVTGAGLEDLVDEVVVGADSEIEAALEDLAGEVVDVEEVAGLVVVLQEDEMGVIATPPFDDLHL